MFQVFVCRRLRLNRDLDPKKPKVFPETLVPKGGVILKPPPTNSKTKDATRMKLCTVIVRHISTKNQQLDFQISIVPLSVAIVLFGVRS